MFYVRCAVVCAVFTPQAIMAKECIDPASMLPPLAAGWELFNDAPAQVSDDLATVSYALILPTHDDGSYVDASLAETVSIRLGHENATEVRQLIEQGLEMGLVTRGPLAYPMMVGSDAFYASTVVGDVFITVDGNGAGAAMYLEDILDCALTSGMTPIGDAELPASMTTSDVGIDASVDFTQLDRGAFVDASEDMTKATWNDAFAIFSRIDPSIAAAVPAYQRADEFRDSYACIFDTLLGQDALADMNLLRDGTMQAIAYLQAHPEMNLTNIADHDVYLDKLMPPNSYLAASQSCGLFDLNADIVAKSGIFELMKKVSENAD